MRKLYVNCCRSLIALICVVAAGGKLFELANFRSVAITSATPDLIQFAQRPIVQILGIIANAVVLWLMLIDFRSSRMRFARAWLPALLFTAAFLWSSVVNIRGYPTCACFGVLDWSGLPHEWRTRG